MSKTKPARPRLLIEEWLPAQAIGVECMRERSTGLQPPDKRLHVWWARRPLTVSRAAVLGSLLPADFDKACFERLLGFYGPGRLIVENARKLELSVGGEKRIPNPHGPRAFGSVIPESDLAKAHAAATRLWGATASVLDPMAGGGSIPLEAARLGFHALANEYNPVACSVLEATTDYPFRFGKELAETARKWGALLRQRFVDRMARFYAVGGVVPAWSYIFARTVPCPDTGHPTPLVPDWSLLRPKGGIHVVAEPIVDKARGTWTMRVREVGRGAGQLRQPPAPTYGKGDGISLFTGNPISGDYLKAMAQQGKMGSDLYAIATKATRKLGFRPAEPADLAALAAAERELARLRPQWEREGVIPTEEIPPGDKTGDQNAGGTDTPLGRGETHWADLFAPRQLLALGVLVEELRALRAEVVLAEGHETGEAILHLLALALDKHADHSSSRATWEVTRSVVKHSFHQHDFGFKATFAEMAPCVSGGGLAWAVSNAIEAYEDVATLPRTPVAEPVCIAQGDAASLPALEDRSLTAVVMDPPYADNVQYSELADFFYVWLKRTQGQRRPEWFASYLCDKSREAVKNLSRHRPPGFGRPRRGQRSPEETATKTAAQVAYERSMAEVFGECCRVLRDDGVLTVMFTHKKQEAWEALFASLITAGFTITATWPVQTESQHSLHQAKKNAAQSTVLLVARKREGGGERGLWDELTPKIREKAREKAAALRAQGLNAVDQLVGAFGPAMEVFSSYQEVRTDTGESVGVGQALQAAADAVAEWRVEQLAQRGLQGVDAESRFILLCWDVLGAAEFRFNEAMLLGRSVGMDVNRLKESGLIASGSDKVKLLPARERRREKEVRSEKDQLALLDVPGGRRRRPSRKVHPNDEYFVSAIDMCHALALRCLEARGEQAGIGAARGLALQQGWKADGPCARLMEALVQAAPEAVQFPGKGKQKTAADEFPEFRAWHALLKPVFGLTPPEWKPPTIPQGRLALEEDESDEEEEE